MSRMASFLTTQQVKRAERLGQGYFTKEQFKRAERIGAYMTVDELTHGIGDFHPIPSVQIVDRYFDPALLDPKHVDTSLAGLGDVKILGMSLMTLAVLGVVGYLVYEAYFAKK